MYDAGKKTIRNGKNVIAFCFNMTIQLMSLHGIARMERHEA